MERKLNSHRFKVYRRGFDIHNYKLNSKEVKENRALTCLYYCADERSCSLNVVLK